MLGAEVQDHFELDQRSLDPGTGEVYAEEDNRNFTGALYLQDEVRLAQRLTGNIGIRYDHYDNFGSSINPRAALIYNLREKTALKLLFGTAFRAPSDYELHPGVDRIASPGLEPEKITSFEVVAVHYLDSNFRLITSVYQNNLSELTALEDEIEEDVLIYENDEEIRVRGVEWRWSGSGRRGPGCGPATASRSPAPRTTRRRSSIRPVTWPSST